MEPSQPDMGRPKARLRRGVVRESCDFCHRRKIKCDRFARGYQGNQSCSQCALRQLPCRMDDTLDIRVRNRRQASRLSAISPQSTPTNYEPPKTPSSRPGSSFAKQTTASLQEAGKSNNNNNNNDDDHHSSLAVSSLLLQEMPPAAPSNTSDIVSDQSLPGNPLSAYAAAGSTAVPFANPCLNLDDFAYLDDSFQLAPESAFFLDSIFMGGDQSTPAWACRLPSPSMATGAVATKPLSPLPTASSDVDAAPGQETRQMSGGFDPPLWQSCDMSQEAFSAALHAYFDCAALYLPVLFEDAFWQDFHAGHCSRSLVFAIACRGLPFTAEQDKWAMQQRAAAQFCEAFLNAQLLSSGQHQQARPARIDDLEALALMDNFQYADPSSAAGPSPQSPPSLLHTTSSSSSSSQLLQPSLARLYLTHASLVLMTLDAGSSASPPPPPPLPLRLAREDERRTLLFWHVFGLDSFHCLDKKCQSRIPDTDSLDLPDLSDRLPRHDHRGYLDAILGLAVIARKASRLLCSPLSKRRGIPKEDVLLLFQLLEQWRLHDCPSYLRRPQGGDSDLAGLLADDVIQAGSSSSSTTTTTTATQPRHVQLRRAVIWLLEINCYLAIESFVSEYSIHTSGDVLDAEAVGLLVESKSVQAARDAHQIAQWILKPSARLVKGPNGERSFSLADLAPHVVRDCVAGVCFWTCSRGQQWLHRQLPSMLSNRSAASPRATAPNADVKGDAAVRQHCLLYVQTATTLKEAIVTAVSHKDTQSMVDTLSKEITSLSMQLGSTEA